MAGRELEWRRIKARALHVCAGCGGTIGPGEFYYRDKPVDRFLQSLHSKPYCEPCHTAGMHQKPSPPPAGKRPRPVPPGQGNLGF